VVGCTTGSKGEVPGEGHLLQEEMVMVAVAVAVAVVVVLILITTTTIVIVVISLSRLLFSGVLLTLQKS
jgi:hypothetical protein